MWYSVLTVPIQHETPGPYRGTLTLRVGGVYQVRRHHDPVYGLDTVQYRSVDTLGLDGDTEYGEPYGGWFEISVEGAREHFTRPTKDLNDAIEQSFMVCEAEYC